MYPSLLNNIFPSINQAYPWPPKASEEKFFSQGYGCPQWDVSRIVPWLYYLKKFFLIQQRITNCFDLGRKVLHGIIRSLKWAPFMECLVAFYNTSFTLLLFPSHPVVSNSLWPHGLQHMSLTISQSFPKFMSIALVMSSSRLILL